jgi:hypothetical protein
MCSIKCYHQNPVLQTVTKTLTSTNTKSIKTNIVNLASAPVDQVIIKVLQEGLNFAVAPKSIPTDDFICSIEFGIHNKYKEEAEVIRQEATCILRKRSAKKTLGEGGYSRF